MEVLPEEGTTVVEDHRPGLIYNTHAGLLDKREAQLRVLTRKEVGIEPTDRFER
jgi:hypothetical protein